MDRSTPGKFSRIIQPVLSQPWVPLLIAVLAGLVFLIQAVIYAHTQDVTMDEGTYLMKGLLFVRGDYIPFAEYGPWTNKMPLAFYIPGVVQFLFGPGLRTGRYFSIFLALLILLGLWILSRRLAGRWFAAGVLWVMAASPATILMYTWAVSQVIVACLLTWSLVLTLGKERPLWQIILGALLAVMTVLTRQNMLPVIPFILIYIFWQHGIKAGGYATAASSLLLIFVHAIFWPNIWYIWRPWAPEFIRNLVNIQRNLGNVGTQVWNPEFTVLTKIFVFWEGIRFNFFALWGALISWIFWPRRREWKSDTNFKMAVFLSVTLVVLTAAHYWAAAFKDYCLFCYSGYLSFFAPLGLLLVVVSFSSWIRKPGPFRQILAGLSVLVGATGIAFGAYNRLYEFILNFPVPRVTNMRILPGSTQLWRSLSNKFDLSFETLQQLLPTIAGALFALLLLVLVAALALKFRHRSSISFGYSALLLFFVLGILLTPTSAFSGDRLNSLCGWDVIASHEAVGNQLKADVPAGSLVYWQNDVSPLPLLYIPDVKVYPAQLNHWYTFREGGDVTQLNRLGYWNSALQRQWLSETEYALVADVYIERLSATGMINDQHTELGTTPLTVPCRGRSTIHIFRREP
jgi:hypothetical protein